jgi:hypothetical protein
MRTMRAIGPTFSCGCFGVIKELMVLVRHCCTCVCLFFRYVYVGTVLCLFSQFFVEQYLNKPKGDEKAKKALGKSV